MKLIPLLILLLSSPLFCQETILSCLGKEEERLHKEKSFGAPYKLNQALINEFAGSSNIVLTKTSLTAICQKDRQASLLLIREILLKGEKVFDFKTMNERSEEFSYQISLIDELLRRAPHYFFSYLSDLQGLTPKAGCLDTKIPELKLLHEKFHYLETEVSLENLLKEGKLLTHIFDKLANFDTYYEECQKEIDEELKKEKNELDQKEEKLQNKRKRK